MTRRYRALAAMLLLDVVGAGGALLLSARVWQHLQAPREGPFPDARVGMTGRDVDGAITALALVALAGVVAVLATRGQWRRIVGGVVALAGAGMIWRAIVSSGAVGNERALSFVAAHRQTATTLPDAKVDVDVVAWWPALTIACGVLVLLAGLVVAVRGGRWQGMSARYEVRPAEAAMTVAPGETSDAASAADARATAAMWSALDRGEDPTSAESPTTDPPTR